MSSEGTDASNPDSGAPSLCRWIAVRALETFQWELRTPQDARTLGRNLIALGKRLIDAAEQWEQPPPTP